MRKKKKKKSIDIWLEFSSILIYLVVSTQSFIHSRLNRKHDISLIEHQIKKKEDWYFSIIVLAFDSITRTISILSWSFLYSLSFFFPCLSGVKRLVVLLLLCRISRTLSFLVCLMMTCTRTQGIRIQADDAHIHKRVYRRHCHLCRCCMYIYIYIYMCVCVCQISLFFLFAMRCGDVTCEVHFHPNHHHMLFSHLCNQCHLSRICIFGWKKK
jgi:hypothetical protein